MFAAGLRTSDGLQVWTAALLAATLQYQSERSYYVAGVDRGIDAASTVYLVAEVLAVADRMDRGYSGPADWPDVTFFRFIRRRGAADSRDASHRLFVLA